MKVVTLEGIDGSGKSLQTNMLAKALTAKGIKVFNYREPGSTKVGEVLREILLSGDTLSNRTDLLIFLASRCELIEHINQKHTEPNTVVIIDRFIASSVVYQGIVEDNGMTADSVYSLCLYATQDIKPDLEIYLDITPEVGVKRMLKAGKQLDARERDRNYMDAVYQGYNTWYNSMCDYPYTKIDSNIEPEEITSLIINEIT